MLKRFLLVVVFWLGLAPGPPPPAAEASTWSQEPSGATVLFDYGFEHPTANGVLIDIYNAAGTYASPPYPYATAGTAEIVSTDGRVSAPYAYRSKIRAGSNSGGSDLNYVAPGGVAYREIFMGLEWWTNPEFFGRQVANKMFFLRGPESNGFFGLMGGPGGGNAAGSDFFLFFGHNSGNVNNGHACGGDSLGLTCFPNVGSRKIPAGTKANIQVYMKASTSNTSRDGIVKWWVEGELQGSYTNLNLASKGLNTWVWSETWDGTVNPVPSTDWYHFIDHLKLSIPNCVGDCGFTTPPVTPPPPPPPPPPTGIPGNVTDLTAATSSTTTVNLKFTTVLDGLGQPAKYDIRFTSGTGSWGSMAHVSAGTCLPPYTPGVSAVETQCTVTGLAPNTAYRFLVLPFRGTMNVDAIYGTLSNEATATTSPEPTVLTAPTNISLTTTNQYRVVWEGKVWDLRGTVPPLVLYVDGVCGSCDVVGYSITYQQALDTLAIEFVPGKYMYLDVANDEWVIIAGQMVGVAPSSVVGSFAYAGTTPNGFFVYYSALTGGVKAKLPLSVGPAERAWVDSIHAVGCYQVVPYDTSGIEGFYSVETCTANGAEDIGLIHSRKVIDFKGREWELMGETAPYVLYRDGVCECSLAGYSLRYASGVVEMEYVPGKWIRRDDVLNDWAFVVP